MGQIWNPPSGSTLLSQAVKTDLPAMLSALRSLHAGTSAPPSTEAWMLWADTANNQLKQRNGANSAFVVVAPLVQDWGSRTVHKGLGGLTATATHYLLTAPLNARITRLILVSDTATTGSAAGTTEWQFSLRNRTAAVNLFSGTVGTGTALGGVGGGAEIAVDTAYILTPNQNQSVLQNAVLDLVLTKVGAITNLGRVDVFLEFTISG